MFLASSRRNLVQAVGLTSVSLAIPSLATDFLDSELEPMELGLIADTHIGLAPRAEKRLEAFLSEIKNEAPDAILQLGDFAFPQKKYQSAADMFNAAHPVALHTIGNHDLDFGLTKDDCLKAWRMPACFYRKDVKGIRILVLDGNDIGSPSHRGGYPKFIGEKQQTWLAKELRLSDRPLIIASHQPLAGPSSIDNAQPIQKLLGKYRDKILLCINGHTHIDMLTMCKGVNFLHINSASYFWIGGKARMAHYNDPLFTRIRIDSKKRQIIVRGKKSSWQNQSPADHGYFEKNKDGLLLKDAIMPEIRPRKIKV